MEPPTTHEDLVTPSDRTHVNTEGIAPARFLKTVKGIGFADVLLANWRFAALR